MRLLLALVSVLTIACSAKPPAADSQAFLEKAAAEPGAVRTADGLIFRELRPGTGASPGINDAVKVNYRGTFINGVEFDSSYKHNAPGVFPLRRMIPCWREGLQRMKVGGKYHLVCPPGIAYGKNGIAPVIPPDSTIVFDVELLAIL